MKSTRKQRFIGVPGLKATSCLTVVLLIFLETVLLSTVSNCAKTFFMHWNTSNSIFRIDNTDHIIDVNKGNLAFEYDQVHIICPVYEPGTFDNETEKYIIYNVSKVEYETCRITNANPRIIAICDKPQKLMYFTITFRPFTPQPGGLEFLPGNDYYFISTSSKDDLHRRIGGRCSTNNMKVVFKVCCASETDSQNATQSSLDGVSKNLLPTRQPSNDRSGTIITGNITGGSNDGRVPPLTINTNRKSTMTWLSRENDGSGGYRHSIPITSTISVQQYHPHPTSSRPFINSAINKFNKNPNNNNNNKNYNNNNYNHSNNAPSLKPTKKTNEYDKHPNEVVKNEELTLNNHGTVMRPYRSMRYSTWFPLYWIPQDFLMLMCIMILVFANYYDHLHTMIQSYLPNLWWTTMLSFVMNDDSVETQTFLNYLKSDVIPGDQMQRSNYNRFKTTSEFVKLHAFKRNNINEIDISNKHAIAERVSMLTKIITTTSLMPHTDTIQPTCILEKIYNDDYYSRGDNAFYAFVINAIHSDDQVESDNINVNNRTKTNFIKNHLDDFDKFDYNKLNKLNVCHSSKNKNLGLRQMQIGRRNCRNSKTQTTSAFGTDADSNLDPEMIIIINTKSLIS